MVEDVEGHTPRRASPARTRRSSGRRATKAALRHAQRVHVGAAPTRGRRRSARQRSASSSRLRGAVPAAELDHARPVRKATHQIARASAQRGSSVICADHDSHVSAMRVVPGRRRVAVRGRSVRLDLHVEQRARRLRALERLEVRVADRDHVPAAVAVEAHRPDRLADLQVARPPARRPGTQAACRAARSAGRLPVGSGPGDAVKKRIASGCANCGRTSSSGSSSPSAIRSCTSTRSTPTAHRTRSAICPPGIRAAHSTTITRPSGAAISCGNAIPVRRPSACTVCTAIALRHRQLLRRDRRRVDVDPPDAEPDARRPHPVGERQQDPLAVARDHDAVHLRAVDVLLEDRLAASATRRAPRAGDGRRRRATRRGTRRAGLRCRPASAPPGSRLRRPRDASRTSVRTAAKRGCGTPASASRRRIAILWVIKCAVSVPIPGRPRASATAATTGTARSADTVSTPSICKPRRRLQHGRDVGEVDDLRDVRLGEPRRVGIPVDGRDAKAELLRPENRAALVAACTDEENGPHGRRILLRRERPTGAARAFPRRRSGRRSARPAAPRCRRRRSRGIGRACRAARRRGSRPTPAARGSAPRAPPAPPG